jgi:hypothetical protein
MRPLELGLWGASAVLILAAPIWPSLGEPRAAADTRLAAEKALNNLAARERAFYAAHQRFLPFGATAAERQAAFPDLTLDPDAENFAIDGFVDHRGTLHLRAVSSPAAIQQGKAAPLLLTLELPSGSGASRP